MQHLYRDTSHLNAEYSGLVPLTGLGASDASVLSLQQQINRALKSGGDIWCPIAEDGALGPKTCGGAVITGLSYPNECYQKGFGHPSAKPCPPSGGGGGGGGGVVAPSPDKMVTPPVNQAGFGISSDTWWIIGGAAIAVAAVGTAIYAKKHRRGV
jgi:hypothetical protein